MYYVLRMQILNQQQHASRVELALSFVQHLQYRQFSKQIYAFNQLSKEVYAFSVFECLKLLDYEWVI